MYRFNLIHIEDYVEKRDEQVNGYKIGQPLENAEKDSLHLIKIRSIVSAFGTHTDTCRKTEKAQISEITGWIEATLPGIIKEVEILVSQKSYLETSLKEIEQKISLLTPFSNVPFPMELLKGYDSIGIIAGYTQKPVSLSCQHELYESRTDSGSFVVIAVQISDLGLAEKELLSVQFQKIPIPDESGYALDCISGYLHKIESIHTEIETLDHKLSDIRDQYQPFLASSEELLRADVQQAEAPLRFATTDLTFIVTGWVPFEKISEIFQRLNIVTDGKVYTSEIETDDINNDPPVEFDNPRFAHPTELFVDLMSRPRYTEIDPTLLMAVLYPLMFGMILGDVGYGLILLMLSYVLKRRVQDNETGLKLMKTLTTCSLSSIGFGVLFSEFLGFQLPWEPIGFSRHIPIGVKAETGSQVHHAAAIPELLVISIWIGILHITLGWIWGIRNAAVMEHGYHRTLKMQANFGWLLLLWGMLLLIWSQFRILFMPDLTGLPSLLGAINLTTIIGAVMVVLGLIGIARDDPIELFEVPTKSISHVLSYTRLVAVGLSSVAIALVINYIAIDLIIKPQLDDITIIGIILCIIGILVFVIGHVVNTALGVLGSGLHPLRLHYVEFFTKFYRGGGKRYTPFGMIRKLTGDE